MDEAEMTPVARLLEQYMSDLSEDTNAAATVRHRLLRELARREWLPCVEARALCAEIHRSTYCQVIQRLRRAGVIEVHGRGVQARYRLAAGSREGEG